MGLTDWADIFEESDKIRGMFFGIAIDVADPELSGRAKVFIPGIMEPSTDWARPVGMPGGGSSQRGMYVAPGQGSLVLVGFEQGNPNVPFYFHAGWGMEDDPIEFTSPFARNRRFGIFPAPAEAADVFRLAFGRWEFVIDTTIDDDSLLEANSSLRIRDHIASVFPSSGDPDGPFSLLTGNEFPDLGIVLDKGTNTLVLTAPYDVEIRAGIAITLNAPSITINERKVKTTTKPV